MQRELWSAAGPPEYLEACAKLCSCAADKTQIMQNFIDLYRKKALGSLYKRNMYIR